MTNPLHAIEIAGSPCTLAALSPPRLGFLLAAMPRAPITRLREQRTPDPLGAQVIDAEFKVVGRRTRLAAIRRGLIALCAAAAIGFLIPPVWVLVENLREMLGR